MPVNKTNDHNSQSYCDHLLQRNPELIIVALHNITRVLNGSFKWYLTWTEREKFLQGRWWGEPKVPAKMEGCRVQTTYQEAQVEVLNSDRTLWGQGQGVRYTWGDLDGEPVTSAESLSESNWGQEQNQGPKKIMRMSIGEWPTILGWGVGTSKNKGLQGKTNVKICRSKPFEKHWIEELPETY